MVDIKPAKMGRYKICKHQGKYYLIDTKFKSLLFSHFTKRGKAELKAILISNTLVRRLEYIKPKQGIGIMTIAMLPLPFVNLTSRIGKVAFQSLPGEHYFLIKLVLLTLAIALGLLVFSFFSKWDEKKLEKKLRENPERNYRKFSLEIHKKIEKNLLLSKKNLAILSIMLSFFFLIFLFSSFFLTETNGSESVLPIVISLLIGGLCVINRNMLQAVYQDYEFIFSEAKDEEKALSNK